LIDGLMILPYDKNIIINDHNLPYLSQAKRQWRNGGVDQLLPLKNISYEIFQRLFVADINKKLAKA